MISVVCRFNRYVTTPEDKKELTQMMKRLVKFKNGISVLRPSLERLASDLVKPLFVYFLSMIIRILNTLKMI